MQIINSQQLIDSLSADLDFHNQNSTYSSHNFHSFPAKFPPQLPQHFIELLSKKGDVVLDPMSGSGTMVLEAYFSDRRAIGVDIDPLALLLTKVKVTPLDKEQLVNIQNELLIEANKGIREKAGILREQLENQWDAKTKKFVDYWFSQDIQLELLALLNEINRLTDQSIKDFFLLVFSSIIITKSGGVSLALDLGHTRPHKAKTIIGISGKRISDSNNHNSMGSSQGTLIKTLRSPIEEFRKRAKQNINSVLSEPAGLYNPIIESGDAQSLSLNDHSVDLIVTSPPYASNAIDYMRAHKFTLVWFGHSIDDLSTHRGKYIGGESSQNFEFEPLPEHTQQIIDTITLLDKGKGLALKRYFSEMKRVIREMSRVLKPGKPAIIVAGDSIMRNVSTDTAKCIAEIGIDMGFENPMIANRNLDRNRRMLPSSSIRNETSQIQKRMHQEYIIGLLKPAEGG